MAKNLTTTGDMVSYAMFLIDRRIKYNEDAEADEVAQLLSINDNVSIRSELETVPENDAVKSPTLPVIIVGVLEPKPAAIMVETVLSDDASEVSLLRDHLMSQQAEQAKVNQAILKQFESFGKGNKIDDKGADMMTKLVIAQTSASVPPFPAESTNLKMGEWMDSNRSILSTTLGY